ncbi:uncharacterized protein BDW70DRAFT_127183, partial [Aspergillus foveolatus]|uniref:uncharacterized protein n=1 Tax=Aspergillus foveolatus TaxID=210207 RepID=UPI003CCD0936
MNILAPSDVGTKESMMPLIHGCLSTATCVALILEFTLFLGCNAVREASSDALTSTNAGFSYSLVQHRVATSPQRPWTRGELSSSVVGM